MQAQLQKDKINTMIQSLSDDAKQAQTYIILERYNNGYSLFSPELKRGGHIFANFISIVQNIDPRDFNIVESIHFIGNINENTTHYSEIIKFILQLFPNAHTLDWDSIYIPEGMFNIEECQQITNLILSSDMTEYPDTLLLKFLNLKKFIIHRSTNLTSLPCGFFNHTPNLIDVSIAYTLIEKFPDTIFNSLTNLECLSFTGNKQLVELPSMLNNSKLTNVEVDGCTSITHISNVFPSSLKRLILSGCDSLTTFDDNFFKKLINLSELDVCSTGLKTLPDSIIYAKSLKHYKLYIEQPSIDSNIPELICKLCSYYYLKSYIDYYNYMYYVNW